MSPTTSLVLTLSLFVLSGRAESEKMTDPFALIRETLKYWRRIYRTYHEEVILGYCWAEYFLRLEDSFTDLPMSRAIDEDRTPYIVSSTRSDSVTSIKSMISENVLRKNSRENQLLKFPTVNRKRYTRRKRSHGTLNFANPNLRATKIPGEQFARDYSNKFYDVRTLALPTYTKLAKKSSNSKSRKTDARYIQRSSLKPEERREDMFSESSYRETSRKFSRGLRNDLHESSVLPISSKIFGETPRVRFVGFLSSRKNPKIVKMPYDFKAMKRSVAKDWKVKDEDLEDHVSHKVLYRNTSYDVFIAVGNLKKRTLSHEASFQGRKNFSRTSNRFFHEKTTKEDNFQFYKHNMRRNLNSNERDYAHNRSNMFLSIFQRQQDGYGLEAFKTNLEDNVRHKRDTNTQTKKDSEVLLSTQMKTGVSHSLEKVPHNSALSLVNKSSTFVEIDSQKNENVRSQLEDSGKTDINDHGVNVQITNKLNKRMSTEYQWKNIFNEERFSNFLQSNSSHNNTKVQENHTSRSQLKNIIYLVKNNAELNEYITNDVIQLILSTIVENQSQNVARRKRSLKLSEFLSNSSQDENNLEKQHSNELWFLTFTKAYENNDRTNRQVLDNFKQLPVSWVIKNRQEMIGEDEKSFLPGKSPLKKLEEKTKEPIEHPAGAPSLVRVREQRFMEDYENSTSRTSRNSRLTRSLGSKDQGRRSSDIVLEARGLTEMLMSALHLHPAFMAVLRTLGLLVHVGRQIIDVVESNTALACTKDYLWIKVVKWIDS